MTKNDNHEHQEHNEHDTHKHPPEDQRGKHPRPVGDLFTNPWMPGQVQVVFKNPVTDGLEDERERDKLPNEWGKGELKKIFKKNKGTWEPSFPLLYPWSKRESEEDLKRAREFYVKSERGKFVTFHFPPEADVVQIAAELKNIKDVAGIEQAKPVAKVVPPQITDRYFGESDEPQEIEGDLENQWYAFRCNLPQALEQVRGRGVVIAVIDWGFDDSHPDYSDFIKLQRNVKYHNDKIGNGNAIHHGTGSLGLAGARLNSEGMVGFAPDAELWAIQAGEDDEFDPEYWKRGIDFVREEYSPHPKVIILEVQTAFRGNIESNPVINQAIRDAVEACIVVCVPAGNGRGNAGEDEEGNEIQETGSVLVGATDVDDYVIGKTGDRITVYAPGDPEHDLTCTSLPRGYTKYFGGTSGAVAKVGGAVALLLEAHASLTPPDVKEILRTARTKAVYTAGTGEKVEAGYLLDCEYAVSECKARSGQAPVLTNYSAVV